MRWRDAFAGMRGRIALAVAVFATLALLAQAFSLLLAFDEQEEEFIDELLGQQIEYSIRLWHSHPELAFPNTPDMRLVRIPDGMPAPSDLAPEVARLPIGNHELDLNDREHHIAVRHDDGARFILLYDVGEHESRLQSLVANLISGALLLVLILLVGSYFLAGQLAQPLEHLARRVEQGDDQDLVDPAMAAEVKALAAALERARARQRLAIERERAFSANLSHELRTPLTAIRTDAELLSAQALPDGALRRTNRIMDNVDRIQATAGSLLMLARDVVPRESVAIDLAQTILRLWETLHPANGGKPLVLALDVPSGTQVMGDPALVELVLRNLLDNALRYSDAGEIRCLVRGTCLFVIDTGPGFSEDELRRLFERFYSGRQGGHGLGMALVHHACAACGWQPSARNGESGGGEICIDFGDSLRSPVMVA